ncbi:NAD(P)-binding protein [Cystobasidium minutum MCA 4210]|uniref:NAD(P)-binding protein n=1 Tax=Cystobasidium minutum MCA 4210 TaxID=1397322 RepID=UPI0034CE51E8|eukprot:jgi/Rhomi1/168489/fgenesh1_kg.3_\
MDVRDSQGIAEFISSIPSIMGGLHFCINCSGILGKDYDNDLANQPEENWDMVLDINLKAPAIITKEAVKVMLKQPPLVSQLEASGKRKPGTCTRRGVIVNLGSSASLRARSASGSPYIVSKHGLLGLTKSTAVSYGKQGIRCNVLAPGFVNTPLIAGIANKVREIAEGIVPVGRPAEPEEVADQIVYLCSERASYLNGIIMPVDGGWSCT